MVPAQRDFFASCRGIKHKASALDLKRGRGPRRIVVRENVRFGDGTTRRDVELIASPAEAERGAVAVRLYGTELEDRRVIEWLNGNRQRLERYLEAVTRREPSARYQRDDTILRREDG